MASGTVSSTMIVIVVSSLLGSSWGAEPVVSIVVNSPVISAWPASPCYRTP